ncbi:DUF308 domain-containing protein [Luethyella okanaganae]|uniref:DUF308 domain-containing protein n=1 Tax=Luethyella okanaganae TaxID=69372 RepID=A0ABW1VGP9_9MICO
MANPRDAAAHTAPEWIVPLVRAILAVVPAVVITFSPDHSPESGLIVFGCWALATGLVVGALSLRRFGDRVSRSLFAANGVITTAAGILALGLFGGGLGFFLYLVTVWAALTGFLELYAGLRVRGRSTSSRDWLTAGGLTAVLAIVFLLLPPNAVVAVGLLGAYLVILAVFLGIAAFSLKWNVAGKARAATASAALSDSDPS